MGFETDLLCALDRAAFSDQDKTWTKALGDLDDAARLFDKSVKSFTNGRLGTALLPVPPEQVLKTFGSGHKVYQFSLVGDERKKLVQVIVLIAVPVNGFYPVLLLNTNFQPVGMCPDGEALNAQFLLFVKHANSDFMQAVLKEHKP